MNKQERQTAEKELITAIKQAREVLKNICNGDKSRGHNLSYGSKCTIS